MQPRRQGAGRRVAGGAGRRDHPLVVIAVGIGQRRTGPPQALLDILARPHQLVAQRDIVDLGQVRVGARVRADLPAGFGEPAELVESKATVEERLGRDCVTLAYPYGDYDERVVAAAGAAGYAAAGTLPARLPPARPLAWPRLGVYHGDDERRFRLKVSRVMRRLRGSRLWPTG